MNLFGFASGWWSVAGQMSDLAGVAILTYDLLPEYYLHKARRAIEAAKRYNLELFMLEGKPRSKSEPAEGAIPNDIETGRQDMRAFKIDTVRMQARAETMLAASHLGTSLPDVFPDEFREPTAWFDKAIGALENYEEIKRHEVRRTRPPIGWAICLIVLGFALQIVGSLPL